MTGLVLFMFLNKLVPHPCGTMRFSVAIYAIKFSLPLGFCVLNQYWIAVCTGMGSVLLAWLAFGRLHSGNETVNYPAKPANLQKI